MENVWKLERLKSYSRGNEGSSGSRRTRSPDATVTMRWQWQHGALFVLAVQRVASVSRPPPSDSREA